MLLLCRIVVCNRRTAGMIRYAVQLGIPATTCTYNKAHILPSTAADLHALQCTIRTKQHVVSLCEKKKKEEKQFHEKEFPTNVVALPGLPNRRLQSTCSRRAAAEWHCQTWHPGYSWYVQQSTISDICT
jgi:hypothetical protein